MQNLHIEARANDVLIMLSWQHRKPLRPRKHKFWTKTKRTKTKLTNIPTNKPTKLAKQPTNKQIKTETIFPALGERPIYKVGPCFLGAFFPGMCNPEFMMDTSQQKSGRQLSHLSLVWNIVRFKPSRVLFLLVKRLESGFIASFTCLYRH